MVGDLKGYGVVWYHPSGIANILSLSRMREHGHCIANNSLDNQFVVTKSDGASRIFKQSVRGLFYVDTSDTGGDFTMVNTVDDNKSSFTNCDYSHAVLACKIQKMIGQPSTAAYLKIVKQNLLPNCPITARDILAAERIFGPDVGSLKGKTVRRAADHVEISTVDIPSCLIRQYRNIVLTADIMFVNKIPFLVTISRHIKFGTTAEILANQQLKTILGAIKSVNSLYSKSGFILRTILMDGQFESLHGDLARIGTDLNTVSNDDHVPEVKWYIRTLKERT
jgi:hypothetical protein